jgi:cell wall-associated NlpC family hydrolase
MRNSILSLVFLLCCGVPVQALSLKDVNYTFADSAQVVQWLEEARDQYVKADRMLFFARKFLGLPYVANTLDRNKNEEKLVVNLRELDCTTFVENVAALSLTAGRGSTSFYDFCEALERLRYTNGMLSGYASRNHYFSEWIQSNQDMGLLKDIFDESSVGKGSALTPLSVQVNYMSRHADRYPFLKAHPDAVKTIAGKEQAISGRKVWFLPKGKIKGNTRDMQLVQEGDVVAFVTKRAGLDIAHVGILCRERGEWHFMHASSLRKKVVLEPLSLVEYLQKQTMQTGIRVVRVH